MPGGNVRYAQNGGVSIAYDVFGSGERDLVFVCGTMSHLELWWNDPDATEMLERLSRFARVILFDKPGTGLSDPVPAAPTVEQRADDIVAVLDAVGSERAIVVGFSEGGFASQLLAATRPERVEALVLVSTVVVTEHFDPYPVDPEQFARIWAAVEDAWRHWGEGRLLSALAPTWASGPQEAILGSVERTCMSPGMARSVLEGMHDIDLRDVVPAIRVPTLVLHSPDETWFLVEMGRDLAARIPGARFVPLVGPDHLFWIDNAQRLPDAVEEFVTGATPGPHDDHRVLATVVFTDIVDSTRRLAAVGDAAWRRILAQHDRRMDDLLSRHGGRAVKHTGDGRMARFDRPARAVRFATAMVDAARELGLEIRAGLHTGECEAVGDDLFGLAVVIASRVSTLAGAAEVLVSSTVADLVIGSGLAFEPAGEHELKGAPGRWRLLRATADRPGPLHADGYDLDVREPAVRGT
ncbi:MAG TPA: adenylate/guanylate cyclase domain-containing protein [Acidimicrobiales bacterium]|nr:adenylate/guanylate cyclase domain-containing protein [Acidimicrobiales bacterium]